MVTVILEMYHIWYYGRFEKNIFLEKVLEKAEIPRVLERILPIFQFLPSQARTQCLGWGCHGIYTAYCAYENSKYIEKLEKKGKILLTNSYFDKKDSSQSSTF